MAYYTKEILKTRVKQLEEATGLSMELVSCNGYYSIHFKGGPSLGWAGCFHTVKENIIFVEGFLAGMKFNNK